MIKKDRLRAERDNALKQRDQHASDALSRKLQVENLDFELQEAQEKIKKLQSAIVEALNYADERWDEWGQRAIDTAAILKSAIQTYVCLECNDTHWIELEGRGKVMCTDCPVPCHKCRKDGLGAYCQTTPCKCECHKK